jgi:hypothetical protein
MTSLPLDTRELAPGAVTLSTAAPQSMAAAKKINLKRRW